MPLPLSAHTINLQLINLNSVHETMHVCCPVIASGYIGFKFCNSRTQECRVFLHLLFVCACVITENVVRFKRLMLDLVYILVNQIISPCFA